MIHLPYCTRLVFLLFSAGLFCCFSGTTSAAAIEKGYLTGSVILENNTPMSGAFIYLHGVDRDNPNDGVFWRAPDHIVGQLDRYGRFDVEIEAGDYYLTIIKRSSGRIWGPLQQGDMYYLHRITAGTKKIVSIRPGQETNLGKVEGRLFAGRGVAGYPEYKEIAVIYGTLTDNQSRPVPNAFILIYSEPDQMGPTLFSAGPSKADGSYSLSFYEEGKYYLVARTAGSGNPAATDIEQSGILLGRYGGKKHQPILINNNDVKTGIDITLFPFETE